MKIFIATLALIVGAMVSLAQAQVQKPVYTCSLSFSAGGGGVQIILGRYVLKGSGILKCVDVAANTVQIPVKITMGSPIAPNIAAGVAKIHGVTAQFTVGTPQQIFGNYAIVGAQAAVIVGAGIQFGMRGTHNGLTLNVAGQLETGAGGQIGIQRMRIEPLN